LDGAGLPTHAASPHAAEAENKSTPQKSHTTHHRAVHTIVVTGR